MPENIRLTFGPKVSTAEIEGAISQLRQRDPGTLLPDVEEGALESLKFSDCLPPSLGHRLLTIRFHDQAGVQHILHAPTRFVTQSIN